MASLSLSALPFILFIFTFTDLGHCITQNTSITEYLKLPLLHKTPPPSALHALSLDNHRLSLLHSHRALKSPIVSGAPSGAGQYFVSLRLGSPPQTLLLVVDTGSDLIWVQCSACRNCSNRVPGSAFLARHSSTFSPTHCFDSACQLVSHPEHTSCNHTRLHSPCRYEYLYADGSLTSGFFSRETATLNTSSKREARHKDLAFGCGFRVSGPSVTGSRFNGAHGVLGLGRGPISFPSQLGRRFGHKFSYCLMDYTLSPPPTSYLMIGDAQNEVISNMNFTPLLKNPLSPTFYYIGIRSVFVNNVKLRIDSSVWSLDESGNGGTVIDSGTTLTFLAAPAYRLILKAFDRRVKLPRVAVPAPGFDLCINVSSESKPRLPRMSFKLLGDSVFSPPPRNYFIDTSDGVKCLAIQPVDSVTGFSVIGNVMQQGYLFEFDMKSSRLGFTRRGCAHP
ncbi:aspartic proteinase nepenthesin-1 [Tripterygium wilfordii]|uniref:Aspartic proteinase nepenthesin-1 n=1 Tax=Tripterygium wilfordii TaxID=458696 RepID=A0A7J7DG91_TRIWF|nr:aspartyl protease family protein 2 [Tripterygium wilfordii]KAF5745298.1 aspartic proteinase nepenthesin-1 [Tripterygium wilfordii]